MTYIEYIQQSWREKKEKSKKHNVYQLHNNTVKLIAHNTITSDSLHYCNYLEFGKSCI